MVFTQARPVTDGMRRLGSCPACGAGDLVLVRSRVALSRDLADALAGRRKLMHATPTDVFGCQCCGSLCRDPAAVPNDLVDRYRDDEYGAAELIRLHRLGVDACTRERCWLGAHGLRPRRRILEVGSYVGGLLAVAANAGCDVVGVDVGREVTDFTRALGFDVVTAELETACLPPGTFDAVFVMNCFEQLPDPAGTLWEIRRLLREDGRLVVRTPNAVFVRGAHRPASRAQAHAAGVLGVPFARCFAPAALRTMMLEAGLAPTEVRGARAPWMDVAAVRRRGCRTSVPPPSRT